MTLEHDTVRDAAPRESRFKRRAAFFPELAVSRGDALANERVSGPAAVGVHGPVGEVRCEDSLRIGRLARRNVAVAQQRGLKRGSVCDVVAIELLNHARYALTTLQVLDRPVEPI